ncbi:MAG: hypothetical protein QXF82_00960 [Nitrososphaeria archaeon]
MSKKQKKQLLKGVLFLTIAFIALVIFMPMFPVEAVEVGASPTLWQNVHKWFSDVNTFFVDTWGLFLIMIGIAFGGYYYIKKK